jgi:hypothetical protein
VSKEFIEVVRRLATDEEFRAEFMGDPRKCLSDLGVSSEMVEKVVPALMAAVATGGIILQDVEPLSTQLGWR